MPFRAGAAFRDCELLQPDRNRARARLREDLFLGSETAGIADTSKFPVSQDQRNTVRGTGLRFQARIDLWFADVRGIRQRLACGFRGTESTLAKLTF